MGYAEISLKLPTDYDDEQVKSAIRKELQLRSQKFTFRLLGKSLDARKKSDIHWLIRIGVVSDKITNDAPSGGNSAGNETHMPIQREMLEIPYRKREQKVLVAGSGPAGFFAAYVLQKSGFDTTLVERGTDVKKRAASIKEFESTGHFNPVANYAFGEGGAGTFSDGKLTSRSKHISKEKRFVLSCYVQAGAPEEILYMAHPHLGSDNLRQIVRQLRKMFLDIGGTILFETMLEDLKIKGSRVQGALTRSGGGDRLKSSGGRSLSRASVSLSESRTSDRLSESQTADNVSESPHVHMEIEADEIIIAPGHSAYETFRMLMGKGVQFRSKSFAIGCRVEHPQELVNIAQWGRKSLPGVKAAEYRLTSKGDGQLPVYTFCMCPGGVIVPATAYETCNIVNGMSRYQRNGKFANAACVAGVNLGRLLSREIEAAESLEWIEALEHRFYSYSDSYSVPFCTIQDFIDSKSRQRSYQESSYPLGLIPAPLWELLPAQVSLSLRQGLKDFGRKLRGFETGLIMGLESKTSSPVSVIREKNYRCTGFDNLYMAGEGSGHSGGIISSAADGIRVAMSIISKYSG
ncbi:MAG: FAD-dependent monooxygenase [Desulfamplus sp.]|nr:FAD-dependent monooxygenase [Desulfamplus sp.]